MNAATMVQQAETSKQAELEEIKRKVSGHFAEGLTNMKTRIVTDILVIFILITVIINIIIIVAVVIIIIIIVVSFIFW